MFILNVSKNVELGIFLDSNYCSMFCEDKKHYR